MTPSALTTPAHLATLDVLRELAEQRDLNPHFRAGIQRELTRAKIQADRNERYDPRLGDVEPIYVRSAETIQAEADAFEARLNSPRGRFLAAILELENLGFYEVESVRAIYCRALADERLPVDHEAIHRATRILAGIPHSTAIEAIQALTEVGCPLLQKAA